MGAVDTEAPANEQQEFLTLSEAASVVGSYLFPSEWSPEQLREPHNPQQRAVRRFLYDALMAEQLLVLVQSGNGDRRLTLEDVGRDEFNWDFAKNAVTLFDGPGGNRACRFSRRSLSGYLAELSAGKPPLKGRLADRRKILDWLVDEMAKDPSCLKKKEWFYDEAQKIASIGPRPFKTLWAEAVILAGQPQRSAGGRRPGAA